MLILEKNLSYISRKYHNKIKQLTAPLQHQFGISYFARQTVSNDGAWEIVTNEPGWIEYSAAQNFYKIDPSLLHPSHYQSGLTVNASHNVPEYLQEMTHTFRKLYKGDHTLCILNQTSRGSEWYFLATSATSKKSIDTYITKINAIYSYLKDFKHQAKSILQENLEYCVDLTVLKEKPFYAAERLLDLSVFMPNDHLDIADPDISPREHECLSHLLQGKTVKETAQCLGLSPRTVEEYLQRLKQKLGCRYNRDLIKLFSHKS